MAKRIQRKRTKGWKMPENAVYVGRPTIFGNPFPVVNNDNYRARTLFSNWLHGQPGTGGGGLRRISLLHRLPEIQGKDLACWCPLDKPCHADVLLDITNSGLKGE